ncbi:hypothetical protein R1sor_012199 [Riccia sorocarpa]|uniref:Uncharacterized protein n=1 Tax=Riccia sorocarpa TaxID=122646 RepID=A0ABD3I3F7_9MARC
MSREQNLELVAPPAEEEVDTLIEELPRNKAHGDGGAPNLVPKDRMQDSGQGGDYNIPWRADRLGAERYSNHGGANRKAAKRTIPLVK